MQQQTTTSVKHNHRSNGRKSPTYQSWRCMKERCIYTTHVKYADYGGRGIKVCDRWMNSFLNFLEDMGPRPEGKTLDRIDPNGNYEPSNCKWSTKKQQEWNKRFRKAA